MLALTFVRSDHKKVILLDMVTSKQSTFFSTTNPNETVENLCFQKNSDFLLISTQYQCCEYNLSTDTLYHIKDARENESLAGANYNGKSIEIVVTQHMENREPLSPTRCEQFKRKGVHEKVSYSQEWYYLLPELTEELYPYFIFFHGDLGMEGTHGETEMQNFCITNGFFLNPSSIDSFTLPILKCYSDKGRPLPDLQLQPLQTIYFRHTKALEYKYREKTSNFSYTYLNEQTKEAVFIQNSLKLYYTANYPNCTYADIENGCNKSISYRLYILVEYEEKSINRIFYDKIWWNAEKLGIPPLLYIRHPKDGIYKVMNTRLAQQHKLKKILSSYVSYFLLRIHYKTVLSKKSPYFPQ